MNNIDDGTGNLEKRIKIFRGATLGQYSWDTSSPGWGINDWTQADLKNELNGDYLNTSLNANTYWYNGSDDAKTAEFNYTAVLSTSAQNLIGDALWHLGGILDTNSGLVPSTMYTKERGTEVWGSTAGQVCNDGYCPRATEWTGKVAIPYPSDYGFATAGGNTTSRSTCINSLSINMGDSGGATWNNTANSDCKDNDYFGWGWKLSPISDTYMYCLEGGSGLFYRTACGGAANVNPAVYLKASVSIEGGNGTEKNPYTLST